jgi:hypothetical protein
VPPAPAALLDLIGRMAEELPVATLEVVARAIVEGPVGAWDLLSARLAGLLPQPRHRALAVALIGTWRA